jgi:EmrB/QacA subfamily drug resistance transporter
MSTEHLPSEKQSQGVLRGFALVSVVIALMLTVLLEALDQTIVGTAMPRIIAQLHGLDRYSWVVTAYILASMTMIPIVGKLSDQFGRKWFLLCGTLLFLLGSMLAGASQSMDQLIVFRAMQGLGAGIGIALVGTVMADVFPPEQRARAGSVFGIVYGFSNLLGPTLGGWLAEHGPLLGSIVTQESRWRWVFYINVPVGLIAVIALMIFLPSHLSKATRAWQGPGTLSGIDFLGAVLCAIATIGLMLGLSWGGDQIYAWNSVQVMGMLAGGLILFVLFLFVERRANEPILPLDLFRSRIFRVGASLSLLQMMVMMGLALYLPLFIQGVLAISPTNAGLVMTPFSVSMVIGAVLGSALMGALKRSRIVAVVSALFMVLGTLLIAFMSPATSVPQAILFMIVAGLGAGPFFSLPMVAVQNALPASRLGVSTAAVRYLGQLGASLGIAVVGTVVASSSSGSLLSHLPGDATSKIALDDALRHGFSAVLVFALITLVVAFLLKDQPAQAVQESPEAAANTSADDQAPRELVQA